MGFFQNTASIFSPTGSSTIHVYNLWSSEAWSHE